MGGSESGAIQLNCGAKPSGTKTLRKATVTETTILGSPPPAPCAPPHRFFGFPTFPPPLLWPTLRGVTRQREAALIFVSAGSSREGPSSSRSPPTHTPGVSKELETRWPPPLPLPPLADLRPFLPLGVAQPALAAPPPPRGPLCLGGLSASSPPRPRGETGLPRRPKRQQARRRRRLEAPLAKEPKRQTLTPHPTPGNARATGVRSGPEGRQTQASPCAAPSSSTSRPGLSRPPRPPVPSTLRPLSAQGRRGSRESPERPPAANSPASAETASRELARRGTQGKRLLRRPRRPDAGPGPSDWQTRGASEAQASAAAAAFQLTPRVRASGKGRRSLTRCQAPRTTWLPGCRAAQAAH